MAKGKRPILAVERLSSDSGDLYAVLNEEPDFSVVLVGVSFLDACLAALLERHFLESSVVGKILNPRNGALGSFGSRSDICYCLGLIDKPLYQDLQTLAEIRNEFAHHHLALSFSIQEVAEKCKLLHYVAGLKNGNLPEPLLAQEHLELPRNRFMLTVVLISSRLMLAALGAMRVVPQA